MGFSVIVLAVFGLLGCGLIVAVLIGVVVVIVSERKTQS